MAHSSSGKILILLSGAALAAMASSAALAGFEWKGPITPPVAQAPAAAPAQGSGADDLGPVILWNGEAPVGEGAMPAVKPVAVEQAAPVDAAPVPASAPAADALDGFGSDLPLAIAIQQVVPAGYRFSFGPGVDAGTSVSWQGGKPWQAVLTDMLASRGLSYTLKDNTVNVTRAQPAAQSSSAAPAPASTAPVSLTAPKQPSEVALKESVNSVLTAPPAPAQEDTVAHEDEFKRVLLGTAGANGVTSPAAASPAPQEIPAAPVAPLAAASPVPAAAPAPVASPVANEAPSALLEKWGIHHTTAAEMESLEKEKIAAQPLAPPAPVSAAAPVETAPADQASAAPPLPADIMELSAPATAPAAQTAAAPEAQKPVEIRREKPVSLLERLGFGKKSEDSKKSEDKAPEDVKAKAEDAAAPPKSGALEMPKSDLAVAEAVEEKAPDTPVLKDTASVPTKVETQAAAAPVPAPAPAAAPAPVAAPQVQAEAGARQKIMSLPEVQDVPPPLPPQMASAAAPVPAPAATAPWHGTKGQTLRDVLKAWSRTAGVDLYWSIDYDYKLDSEVNLSGSYDQAVNQLLDKFVSAHPRPYGQLHQPDGGQKVLVIKSYDLAG